MIRPCTPRPLRATIRTLMGVSYKDPSHRVLYDRPSSVGCQDEPPRAFHSRRRSRAHSSVHAGLSVPCAALIDTVTDSQPRGLEAGASTSAIARRYGPRRDRVQATDPVRPADLVLVGQDEAECLAARNTRIALHFTPTSVRALSRSSRHAAWVPKHPTGYRWPVGCPAAALERVNAASAREYPCAG